MSESSQQKVSFDVLNGPVNDFCAPTLLVHWAIPVRSGLTHECAIVVLNAPAKKAYGMELACKGFKAPAFAEHRQLPTQASGLFFNI